MRVMLKLIFCECKASAGPQRPSLLRPSERDADAAGDGVAVVVAAAEFTVVVEIRRVAFAALDGEARPEEQAVAPEGRAVDQEVVARAVGEAGVAARKLLSRPPHRKRSERGRASGSEGVCFGAMLVRERIIE